MADSSSSVLTSYAEIYDTDKGMKRLATYLRSPDGVKVRGAVEHGKRVEYFKGKRLIETLLNPSKNWPKELPKITDKTVANQVASLLLRKAFYHRSEKEEGGKGVLTISQKKVFEDNGYYTWIFTGSMLWSHVFTFLLIAVVIIFTLLPVWPMVMKKILWYIAVTFLLFMFVFCSLRITLFLSLWVVGYEFWILPRLFDESLGVIESFQPIYSFENSAAGQGYYRMGLVAGFAVFVYWCTTQPTDFDTFLEGQKTFVDDLYSGNLLTDFSQASKDRMDSMTKGRVPNLDDLLRQIELDELTETAHQNNEKKDEEDAHTDNAAEVHADGDSSESNNLEDSILDELLGEAEQEE